MESQGSGRYVKSYSGIDTTININDRTPVCTYFNNPHLVHKRAARVIANHLTSVVSCSRSTDQDGMP